MVCLAKEFTLTFDDSGFRGFLRLEKLNSAEASASTAFNSLARS